MKTETVHVQSQPMIYVRYETSMDSNEIGRLMGEAFQKLGQFIGEQSIAVAGPPLGIYHDYSDKSMTMDVGFPVAAADLAKATGAIKAGKTPSGNAIKVVHRGSYDRLRDTYGEIEAQFKEEGRPMSPMAWEVYVTDPDSTPVEELITEIYMSAE